MIKSRSGPLNVVGYVFLWGMGFFAVTLMFIGLKAHHPSTAAAVSVGGVLILLILQYTAYRHDYYGICSEIRLSDGGTCELETKRRVIRLHVTEIQSVEYSPETDEQAEDYTIRYQGGKLDVNARQMTGFADFLSRLKALNPAVDLSSFPAGWPNADKEETEVNALLPLIVITLLVLFAWHTLSS